MNEAELVECCKRKDMTAQNELYQRYAGEMFALCIRYSGNRDFAKDLLHDGFLKAFTSLDKFFYRGEGSLKAWLSRIMVNTALEAIRKQTQHIELDIETAPEIADPEYEDDDIPENKKVHVVMTMLEAFCDFSDLTDAITENDPYADYHALQAESYTCFI